jgi:transglutaminase-like putative cysteine protease
MTKILILSFLLSINQKVTLKDGTSFEDKILQTKNSTIVFEKNGSIQKSIIDEIKTIPKVAAPKIEFSDTIPIKEVIKISNEAVKKYGSAKGIIIQDKGTNILNTDGTQINKFHFIGKILSPETRSWADIRLSFDETRGNIKVLLARTIHPDGSISWLDYSKIKTISPAQGMVFFNKYKNIVFNLPDVSVGDIVECAYESELSKPYDLKQFEPCTFFGSGEPVIDEIFTVILPDTIKLNVYTRNGAPKARITKEGNNKIYTWEMKDIPPRIEETYMPGAISLVPGVFCTILHSWDYWFDKESNWYKERLEITPEIKELITKVVSDAKTKEDSTAMIYHWVQTNIRYISIKGGLASGASGHPASATLKAGYGDCTDKANLLAAMLRGIGLNAYPVTVYTNDNGRIPYREIPILWGNHQIVEVRTPKDTFWLDPVSETYRYPYFGASDHGILCINSLCRSLDSIPVPPPEDNARTYSLMAEIDTNGNVMLESYKKYTGATEAGLREYYKYTKEDDYKDRFQEMINAESPGAELISYEVGSTKDLMKQFYLQWKYKMANYPTCVGNLWVLKVPEFTRYEFPEVASATRKYNIEYSTSSEVSHHSEIKIPSNYKVNWLPPALKIKNKYVSYTAEYTVKDNKITFIDKLCKYERIIPVKDYQMYKNFLIKVANYSKLPMIIQK